MASDGHELQIKPTGMADQTDIPGAESALPMLLAKTSNLVTNYVDVDEHQALAVALWVAHTKPEETLLDRSIVVQMRPRRPGKALTSLWLPELEAAAEPLRRGFAMLGQSLAIEMPKLGLARVEGLDDRAADLWSPLLAIAAIGGPDLHASAVRSAHELSHARTAEADGLPYELLRDLRDLLPRLKLYKGVFTQTLLDTLLAIDGGRWIDMDDGKPLTASSLAKMLGIFDLRPLTVRNGDVTRMGYRADDLVNVIETYAPSEDAAPPPPQLAASRVESEAAATLAKSSASATYKFGEEVEDAD